MHASDRYGTPRAPVEEALAAGHDMVLEIDYQGARSIRAAMPEAVLVFIAPPTLGTLHERLRRRATESDAAIARRLRSACAEFRHMGMFEYVIVNDDLAAAIGALDQIYLAERQRLRRSGWEGLQGQLLADLQREL